LEADNVIEGLIDFLLHPQANFFQIWTQIEMYFDFRSLGKLPPVDLAFPHIFWVLRGFFMSFQMD
jgi:hypothetical protein